MPLDSLILANATPTNTLNTGDMADVASDAANRAYTLLDALPGEAHFAMLLALGGGVVLWLFGAKLIKPMFGLLGVAFGALVGVLVPPMLGIDAIAGIASWIIGLGLGAVVGLVVSMVLLKIAITFSAGLALGAVGFLGALVYLQYAPSPEGETAPVAQTSGSSERLFEHPLSGAPVTIRQLIESERSEKNASPDAPAPQSADDRIRVVAARARAVAIEAWRFAGDSWNGLAVRERMVLLVSTSISFALGLLAGLFIPKRSTALITALLGSAIWLSAAVWLIEGVSFLSGARHIVNDRSPTAWAVAWTVAAIIGVATQIGGLAKGASSPDTKSDDEEED